MPRAAMILFSTEAKPTSPSPPLVRNGNNHGGSLGQTLHTQAKDQAFALHGLGTVVDEAALGRPLALRLAPPGTCKLKTAAAWAPHTQL
jgi:hypothetical protein